MKYWRGYLVALIFGVCSFGLMDFAQTHWSLVDMIYPYMTRIVQDYLANWSLGVDFCLWQLILIVLAVLALALVVMMILWKWNPIQLLGWFVAAASIVFFLNTVIWGLNNYSGPLAEDIRMEVTDYTVSELKEAAEHYQAKANGFALQVLRDSDGLPRIGDLNALSEQAGEGFRTQTYQEYNAVFSGCLLPVKELSWADQFSNRGLTGIHVGITGEAAVNPQTPAMAMPFVVSRLMAQRMCIAAGPDAAFAAYLTCDGNSDKTFQYSGAFMAYRYCLKALEGMDVASAQAAARELTQQENAKLRADMEYFEESFATGEDAVYLLTQENKSGNSTSSIVDLLVSWHIQTVVLPSQQEEVVLFDPMDETQVDLSGLPHYEEPTENDEENAA